MTERCDFTDLEPGMCAHCRPTPAPHQVHRRLFLTGAGAPAGKAAAAERPWFTALYDGRCAACGDPYPAGAQIRLEMPAGWRADCCRNG